MKTWVQHRNFICTASSHHAAADPANGMRKFAPWAILDDIENADLCHSAKEPAHHTVVCFRSPIVQDAAG